MNTAIIVAAGSGKRFNSTTPKQFVDLLGKPILVRTIEVFEACQAVGEIVVVVSQDQTERLKTMIAENGFNKVSKVVPGGKFRAESVLKGLRAVDPGTRIVLVHDGVRPFVTGIEIESVINAADETGAACLVGPLTDTIKEIDQKRIIRTVDRSNLRRALTPQAFKFQVLYDALLSRTLDGSITDECFLVERLGGEVAIVEGSSANIKITHPDDIAAAEVFLRNTAY